MFWIFAQARAGSSVIEEPRSLVMLIPCLVDSRPCDRGRQLPIDRCFSVIAILIASGSDFNEIVINCRGAAAVAAAAAIAAAAAALV